ncbi:hypothetical protein KP509_18G059400 [Ceratopteris richardii]|uniref:Response regulatory domain-containing protein n=1 Tax=Ceratopteris richardii TaxID=49495 RepID=A0A8T2SPW9_CERRI|nr:hypothetical protein KP509_18G059400 [Ceratopteris richardii]
MAGGCFLYSESEMGSASVSSSQDDFPVHVLAVDDSLIDRKVIERLLKSSACKVTAVDSGRRALEILGLGGESINSVSAFEINLIITDYCMPGMSGYDLLKKVKESSTLKEIPVVIMSSENVPNRIRRCLDEGAEEFLLKPVKPADVNRLRGHARTLQPTSDCTCDDEVASTMGRSLSLDRRRQLSRTFFS